MTTKTGAFNMLVYCEFEDRGFDLSRLDKVLGLAEKSHAGQKRKFTGEPYFYHPISVATTILGLNEPNLEVMVLAALLHDVLEDTKTTEQEILDVAGPEVLGLVKELTNPSKNSSAYRFERKKMDRDHLATVSREAKIIKLADRIDNLKDLPKDTDFYDVYTLESILLLDVLKDASPELSKKLEEIIKK